MESTNGQTVYVQMTILRRMTRVALLTRWHLITVRKAVGWLAVQTTGGMIFQTKGAMTQVPSPQGEHVPGLFASQEGVGRDTPTVVSEPSTWGLVFMCHFLLKRKQGSLKKWPIPGLRKAENKVSLRHFALENNCSKKEGKM